MQENYKEALNELPKIKEKKAFYKRPIVYVPILLLLSALLVYAAVIATTKFNINVNEAGDVEFNGTAGWEEIILNSGSIQQLGNEVLMAGENKTFLTRSKNIGQTGFALKVTYSNNTDGNITFNNVDCTGATGTSYAISGSALNPVIQVLVPADNTFRNLGLMTMVDVAASANTTASEVYRTFERTSTSGIAWIVCP